MARRKDGLHAGRDGLAAVQELDDAAERLLDRLSVRAGQFVGPVPVVPFASVGDVPGAEKVRPRSGSVRLAFGAGAMLLVQPTWSWYRWVKTTVSMSAGPRSSPARLSSRWFRG
jgi:hypothetical protein